MTLRRRRTLLVAAVCGLALASAACGSRLPEQEIVAKNLVNGAGTTTQGTALGSAGSTSGPAGPAGVGTVAGSGAAGAGAGSSAAAGGTATGAAGGSGGTGTSSSSTAGNAPVTIGFIGALSGAGGVFVSPMRDAWIAWAKMMNAQGGINGHPVKVLVGDDGINDARGLAIARDFVENQGAIALSWSSNDITGIANYAKSKHVPVIGTQTSQEVWFQNPYLFPEGPGAESTGWAQATAAKSAGATKIAVLWCVEAPASCKNAADQVVKEAPSVGVQVVYNAGTSITEPDYTANCLQARSKGAQAVIVFMDENSLIRFAQSCHRQNYRPILLGPGGDDMTKISDMQGMISAAGEFPWFLRSGAPGVTEYVQALEKYAPNLISSGSSAQTTAWLSAKIFQQAAEAQVPKGGKPTSQEILDGLWGLKNDTFGGLATRGLARTFNRMKPTANVFCTFMGKLEDQKWVSIGGLTPTCR